ARPAGGSLAAPEGNLADVATTMSRDSALALQGSACADFAAEGVPRHSRRSRAVGRVSGEILNRVETLSLYRAREAGPMSTVKWRGLRMVAVAVAGFVLLAAILAVSPDASEAGRSGSDTTPPGRSDGSPTGTLPAGTTSATLSLKTDEAATCRYSTAAGVAYSRTRDTFSTTGGTSHSTAVGGLEDGSTFTFYVRCQDLSRNANRDDYPIRFSVQSG